MAQQSHSHRKKTKRTDTDPTSYFPSFDSPSLCSGRAQDKLYFKEKLASARGGQVGGQALQLRFRAGRQLAMKYALRPEEMQSIRSGLRLTSWLAGRL
jgi:hypothetical protein